MSTNFSTFNQTQVICNLDTYTFTSNTTAAHVAKARITTMPLSGCTVTIKQNGSTIVSATSPGNRASNPQNDFVVIGNINVTAGDIISWVITSSTAIDQGLNSIKGIIDLHIGSNN